MFKDCAVYGAFAVPNIPEAKAFYGDTLGLDVTEENGMLFLHIVTGAKFLIYPKADHEPAVFTILGFPVDDIDKAVDEMATKGITFESYDFGENMKTDEKGVMRGLASGNGPDIAWFKDPAGNILSVEQG